jgi:hypothetical protein
MATLLRRMTKQSARQLERPAISTIPGQMSEGEPAKEHDRLYRVQPPGTFVLSALYTFGPVVFSRP